MKSPRPYAMSSATPVRYTLVSRPTSRSPPPRSPSSVDIEKTEARTTVFNPDPVHTLYSNSYPSNQVIDLTLDDENKEEDELMDDQGDREHTLANDTVASSYISDTLKLNGHDRTNEETEAVVQSLHKQADLTSEMGHTPLAEEVESDIDEDWPHVSAEVTLPSPLSLKDNVVYNPLQENVRATLDVNRPTNPFSLDRKQEKVLENKDQVKEMQQQTSRLLVDDSGCDAMVAGVDAQLATQGFNDDADTIRSSPTANQLVQAESLEDGEIYEEGSVSKLVVQAKIREGQLKSVDMRVTEAMKSCPYLRSKKQKKRGKKKTKRKLQSMQMMHASPSQVCPKFERTIRLRSFADAPPVGHRSFANAPIGGHRSFSDAPAGGHRSFADALAGGHQPFADAPSGDHRSFPDALLGGNFTFGMIRNGPTGEPINVRPIFQDALPAFLRTSGHRADAPHPPIRPAPQQRPSPLLPLPYEDSQILRVNCQGDMKMIGGEQAELSLHPIVSEPPIYDGFKHRSVSVFPLPPKPNGSDFPLQRSIDDSSRAPPVLTSSSRKTASFAGSKGRDELGDVDLDSLRAAALRTKPKRCLKKVKGSNEVAIAAHSVPSSLRSIPSLTNNARKQKKPTSLEINALRSDILRSMKKKSSETGTSKSLNVLLPTPQVLIPKAIKRYDESKMDKAAQCSLSAVQAISKNPSECVLIQPSDAAVCIERKGPTNEIDKSSVMTKQAQAVSKPESHLASILENTKPSAKYAASSFEFRPLTASSQSLVIQLSPEDYLPRKSEEDAFKNATLSSGLQDAIKEMRRKIAEREKKQRIRLLTSSATELLNQSSECISSSALSSASTEGKVSNVVAQLLSTASASPGVSSPEIVSMKDSSAGVNVARPICAQTEAKQDKKKVVKEILPSPSETLSSVKAASMAAGRESCVTPALEPQVQSDISGVSTIVDKHVMHPILQHELQASNDGQNGYPASVLCVKNSINPVPVAVSTLDNGVVAETPCGLTITERRVLSDEAVFGNDHDFDAIQAEYQRCVSEFTVAEMHIARLSDELAQLEKQLPPVDAIVEKP